VLFACKIKHFGPSKFLGWLHRWCSGGSLSAAIDFTYFLLACLVRTHIVSGVARGVGQGGKICWKDSVGHDRGGH